MYNSYYYYYYFTGVLSKNFGTNCESGATHYIVTRSEVFTSVDCTLGEITGEIKQSELVMR
jgi:hypothetical protein